jgi:protein-S-isoprenylcysteine O-methyltransferase Ste14
MAEQVHVDRLAEPASATIRCRSRSLPAPWAGIVRVSANLVGAIGAAYFVRATWQFYQETHRLIGAVFLVEQTWIVVAYLVRRPARALTRRPADWVLAFAGTFGGVLFRPVVTHPAWGMGVGLALQLVGLVLCIVSFLSLGRSFGFAAADRGLVSRGAYAVVRHPIYASYVVLHAGYVLQSTSWRNVLVMVSITCCNIGRILAEERVLATNAAFEAYRHRVRHRLVPGVW